MDTNNQTLPVVTEHFKSLGQCPVMSIVLIKHPFSEHLISKSTSHDQDK